MDILQALAQSPLAAPMADPAVSEIMINGPGSIFVERQGKKWRTDLHFSDQQHLSWLVERLLEQARNHRLDESAPFVDLSLPNGARVNVVIPPVAQGGAHITIRKYLRSVTTFEEAVAAGELDQRMAAFLSAAVRARLNVLFSGAAGSGKTTLLELLARHIDPRDRVVVLEDTLELHLDQPNVVRLLTRPPNLEGKGAITFDMLFRNTLRMRPDRIILGELRGSEAASYLQAINSGTEGSMAVIHAANPFEAVLRLENLCASSGLNLPRDVAREQIAEGVDVIVQLTQLSDGVRRVTSIAEVAHKDAFGRPEVVELFRYVAKGRSKDGHIQGSFQAAGHRPTYLDRFELAETGLPDSVFNADP